MEVGTPPIKVKRLLLLEAISGNIPQLLPKSCSKSHVLAIYFCTDIVCSNRDHTPRPVLPSIFYVFHSTPGNGHTSRRNISDVIPSIFRRERYERHDRQRRRSSRRRRYGRRRGKRSVLERRSRGRPVGQHRVGIRGRSGGVGHWTDDRWLCRTTSGGNAEWSGRWRYVGGGSCGGQEVRQGVFVILQSIMEEICDVGEEARNSINGSSYEDT